MSLLMRFPTRRGRKAEGLSTPTMRRPMSLLMRSSKRRGSTGRRPKHPDDEKACEFARGPSAVPGPKRPVQPRRSRPALRLSVHSADINGPDAPAPS